MADTIASSFKTYFESLTATNDIIDSFGDTFTFGTNLFIGIEDETNECLSIIPYGGEPPNIDGQRQDAAIQIRLKSEDRKTTLATSQAIINELHGNKELCTGRVSAIQSTPTYWKDREGGNSTITVSNFNVKHVRL